MQPLSSRQHAAPPVQPVIAELLRTCVRPPKLNLYIERASRSKQKRESDSDSDNPSGRTTKLFLTDGQLVIQALLHRKLSNLPGIEDLRKGDIVEIHDFAIRKARRSNGKGHVVYLGIENCYVIQTANRAHEEEYNVTVDTQTGSTGNKRSISMAEVDDSSVPLDDLAGGFFREDGQVELAHTALVEGGRIDSNRDSRNEISSSGSTARAATRISAEKIERKDFVKDDFQKLYRGSLSDCSPAKRRPMFSHTESDSDEEAFETLPIDLGRLSKRRKVLHELSQNVMSSPGRPPTRDSIAEVKFTTNNDEGPARASIVRFNLDEPAEQSRSAPDSVLLQSFREDRLPDNKVGEEDALLLPNINDNNARSSTALLEQLRLPKISSRPVTPIQDDCAYELGKFHTLISLYSASLPSKSYVFTTLVIPTYVASHLIYRPNSTFPPKRHLKVVDPTLVSRLNLNKSNIMGKGITVSVYRDAKDFKPAVGRVALMCGVVMQRLSSAMKNGGGNRSGGTTGNCEVILNVYPAKSRIQRQSQSQKAASHPAQVNPSRQNDAPHTESLRPSSSKTHVNLNTIREDKNGVDVTLRDPTQQIENTLTESWFIDDHDFLRKEGYEVDALQSWWNRMVDPRQSDSQK